MRLLTKISGRRYGPVILAFWLGAVSCFLTDPFTLWAGEPSTPTSAFPEGSSSVIESLTWRVVGSDPTALRQQAKTVVGQIPEAVLVKESETLLVFSLPTQKLSALRQELNKLGTLSASEGAVPDAPTTLLRLMFVQP